MVGVRFGGAQAALVLAAHLISGPALGQQTLVINAPTDPPLTNEARLSTMAGFLRRCNANPPLGGRTCFHSSS